MVKEMIQDVDKSTVIDSGIIDSPVLGKIPPVGLSGGVKTLILVKFEPEKVFNASTCGNNCAKWLLKIAEQEDRTVNLRHPVSYTHLSFRPIVDIQKFITENICDIPDKPNIELMQQNIRDYKRHELLAQRQQEKLDALQQISRLYQEIDVYKRQGYILQILHSGSVL